MLGATEDVAGRHSSLVAIVIVDTLDRPKILMSRSVEEFQIARHGHIERWSVACSGGPRHGAAQANGVEFSARAIALLGIRFIQLHHLLIEVLYER